MSNNIYRPDVEDYRKNERVAFYINHALVILMMASAGFAVMFFLNAFLPEYRGAYLPFLCAFISLESIYTSRIMRRWADLNVYGFTYWIVEWVVILILLRLFLFAWGGFSQLLIALSQFEEDFLVVFFNGEMMITTLIVFFTWLASGIFARDLMELEGIEAMITESEMEAYMVDRSKVRKNLVTLVLVVGFVIVLLSTIHSAIADSLSATGRSGISRWGVINITIYFLLALAFFSQTNYSALRGSWAYQRLPVSSSIARKWTVFTLVFIALVAFLAFLLPTRYSLGLLSTLSYVFSGISYILYYLFMLLMAPLMALVGFIFSLGAIETSEQPEEIRPIFPELQPQNLDPTQIPWLDVVKSLIFWLIFLGITGYAFYHYIMQNKSLAAYLSKIPVVGWLIRFGDWLRRAFQGVNEGVSRAVKTGLERIRARTASLKNPLPVKYLSLRKLTPRQRVMFFYLALVRRSSESGIPRKPWQTPYEYSRDLNLELGGTQDELDKMTDAFVEARYSRHEITTERASFVKTLWDRLKKAIRGKKNG
ncbi:MAG: DUF4129 domain-containing protein [Chloroflexi bacterium]|nr:MAG: DUF4129 domain-containing protein [Chloroflexota bacterium]